jgi:hypothetical protein
MLSSAFVDDVVTTLLNPKKLKGLWQNRNAGLLLNPSMAGLRALPRTIADNAFSGSLLFGLPIAAFSMAHARRERALSTGVGTWTSGILAAVPGAFLGGLPGALITAQFLQAPLAKAIEAPLQRIHDFGRWSQSVTPHMYGPWKDSEAGYTMRQRAANELSGSLMNARQILGKEAVFMHE